MKSHSLFLSLKDELMKEKNELSRENEQLLQMTLGEKSKTDEVQVDIESLKENRGRNSAGTYRNARKQSA